MPRNKAQARLEDDDDPVPDDIDEFRWQLAQKVRRVLSDGEGWWRQCRQPMCRRARRCFATRLGCSGAPVAEPDDAPPEVQELRRAKLLRKLRDLLDAQLAVNAAAAAGAEAQRRGKA